METQSLTTATLQAEIVRLKRETNTAILAHSYQSHDILEIADFQGDSFALSRSAATADARNLLMCGVRFMAETAKLLSPDKRVTLAAPDAGCPMAEQLTKADILALRAEHPGCPVVAYINTTAALKTVADVCVTSASAVTIVRKLDAEKIIFIPDCNLGAYVAEAVPEKEFVLVKGGCPVHSHMTADDVRRARSAHPGAHLLVHPECPHEVVAAADFVGSTSAIMKYARTSDADAFIIGTETSIVAHLQYECPDKAFYPLSKSLICADMKETTLVDVYRALRGLGGEEIILPDAVMRDARRCIDEMIRLG